MSLHNKQNQNDMNEKFAEWKSKFDVLAQRERILLLVCAAVVTIMLMQVVLLDPLLGTSKKISSRAAEASGKISRYQAEKQVVEAQLGVGVEGAKKEQLERLESELDDLNEEIEDSVQGMIPPRLMPEVLEKVLLESQGLKLLSLENQPVVAVLDDVGPWTNSQPLYNHYVVLKISGDYMAVIGFFDRLALLPWKFYWDELSYQVDEYPNATVSLRVRTVSMSEEWIGV